MKPELKQKLQHMALLVAAAIVWLFIFYTITQ